MTIIERCNKFMCELGIPVTAFCRRIQISPQAYYAWRNGDLSLSDATVTRIENHISKYGF